MRKEMKRIGHGPSGAYATTFYEVAPGIVVCSDCRGYVWRSSYEEAAEANQKRKKEAAGPLQEWP